MRYNRQDQLRLALQTARYAAANSSFYQDRLTPYLSDGKLRPEHFYDLPFTDSRSLAASSLQMLCQSQAVRIRTFTTSGSTGTPKRICFGADDLERTAAFFAAGMVPIAPADRPVCILMSDTKPDSIARLLQEGLARTGRRSVIIGRPAGLTDALHKIKRGSTLVGMPADLYYLSCRAPRLQPAAVLLSADYAAPALITQIRRHWSCPVYVHYGLTESCYGLAVQEAEHSPMKIRNRDFLLEIIDPDSGQPLPPEHDGEIVLTSLHCGVQPLIRYRTGDLGRMTGPGSDGFAQLAAVTGRLEHLKKPVNIHRLDDCMYAQPDLAGYEAYLEDDTLRLEVNGRLPRPEDLASAFGLPVSIVSSSDAPWNFPGKRRLHSPA